VTRVLIAGGGVAALEATLALRALAGDRVDVELLAPNSDFVYRPTSVVEPFGGGRSWRYPLARLADAAGARLMQGSLRAVLLDDRRVRTADGGEIEWDVLLLAVGARMGQGVPGSVTFRGSDDHGAVARLLGQATAGRFGSMVFASPGDVGWGLPLYELALMTQLRLADGGARSVRIELVTPEEAPLGMFGADVSAYVRTIVETRGIRLHTRRTPVAFENGRLEVIPHGTISTERVVSLPVPEGRDILGLTRDARGFVRTDALGRVSGRTDVYAVGDMTTFPIKEGGIASQQADTAAAAIAKLVGAPVTPRPFRPVLRGLLFTGLTPRFLAANLLEHSSEAAAEPLWHPPNKLVGRYLSPFLAKHGLSPELGLEQAA
jgi:sulfide:quinone oxidoreductase